jgi:hypothetical protein
MVKLASVKEKLATEHLLSLTAEEVKLYTLYRIENLEKDKKVLVRREMEYFLGETGPGSRRIDPELVGCITEEKLFTRSIITHFPEDLKKISGRKTKLEGHVLDDLHSAATVKLISTLLGHHVKSPEIMSESPLIVAGSFKKVPVKILVVNGGWVMPDRAFFDFLKQARGSKCLAVVIAKKIHGILFPFFKSIGVVGANTYKTYVSGKTYRECEMLEQELNQSREHRDALSWDVTYNERLEDLREFSRDIQNDYYEGDLLKKFLEEILPRVAAESYARGLDADIKLDGDFRDAVMTLEDQKLKKRLCRWIEEREALIAGLENLKKEKDEKH